MTLPKPDPRPVFVLRATAAELPGANLRVAGIAVAERAARQLVRLGGRVILLTTRGTLAKHVVLPASVEIRWLDAGVRDPGGGGDDGAALDEGATRTIAADRFWRAGDSFLNGTPIVDEPTRRLAEDLVFDDLLRGDLGFIARHINKKISFRITRHVLCRLPITPNQVTVGSALIGLLGCALLTTGRYGPMVTGLMLAQLQSILDGCDGELARVRFQQSALGEWLDSLMDDGLNLALIAGIGVGTYRAGLGVLALAVSTATFTMMLTYNVVSYRELLRQRLGGELLKIRWKINGDRNMKALWARPESLGIARRIVLSLGRRDTFVFAWMLLGFMNLFPVILVWAFAVALPSFVAAVAQLILPDGGVPSELDGAEADSAPEP